MQRAGTQGITLMDTLDETGTFSARNKKLPQYYVPTPFQASLSLNPYNPKNMNIEQRAQTLQDYTITRNDSSFAWIQSRIPAGVTVTSESGSIESVDTKKSMERSCMQGGYSSMSTIETQTLASPSSLLPNRQETSGSAYTLFTPTHGQHEKEALFKLRRVPISTRPKIQLPRVSVYSYPHARKTLISDYFAEVKSNKVQSNVENILPYTRSSLRCLVTEKEGTSLEQQKKTFPQDSKQIQDTLSIYSHVSTGHIPSRGSVSNSKLQESKISSVLKEESLEQIVDNEISFNDIFPSSQIVENKKDTQEKGRMKTRLKTGLLLSDKIFMVYPSERDDVCSANEILLLQSLGNHPQCQASIFELVNGEKRIDSELRFDRVIFPCFSTKKTYLSYDLSDTEFYNQLIQQHGDLYVKLFQQYAKELFSYTQAGLGAMHMGRLSRACKFLVYCPDSFIKQNEDSLRFFLEMARPHFIGTTNRLVDKYNECCEHLNKLCYDTSSSSTVLEKVGKDYNLEEEWIV